MHIQYGTDTFLQDLMFRTTRDRENFQGRYVINHPFEGAITCEAGEAYVAEVRERVRQEAGVLMGLTGWTSAYVTDSIRATVPPRFR
jgi:hypothetical protein